MPLHGAWMCFVLSVTEYKKKGTLEQYLHMHLGAEPGNARNKDPHQQLTWIFSTRFRCLHGWLTEMAMSNLRSAMAAAGRSFYKRVGCMHSQKKDAPKNR